MSTPPPDTPDPDEGQHDSGVDAEVSTSARVDSSKPGTGADEQDDTKPSAATKARKRRRPLLVAGVLILALIGWIIYDQVRAPDTATVPQPAASQPAGTTTEPSAAGEGQAVQTVLKYVTLSYAGKWDQACQLDAAEATCLKINSGDPAYPLARPIEVLKTETYPAQGVAGHAYTGVLVSVVQKGATEPALLAYLVNQDNKIAGFEPVSSDMARLTLRQILDRHIK